MCFESGGSSVADVGASLVRWGKFGGGGRGGREHVSEVRVVTEFKYSVITSIRESLISFEHE
jgi:hypothetical protein